MGANQKIGTKFKLHFAVFTYFRLKYGKNKIWFSFTLVFSVYVFGLGSFKLSQFEYLFKLKVF